MKITVLGCSPAELSNARLSGFLVDDNLLLDAGTIGVALDKDRQEKIRYVLLSHAHFDHIKDLLFFADEMALNNNKRHVTVMSIPEVIGALKKNVFNNIIWPDFTKLPTLEDPVIVLKDINADKTFTVDGYKVTAYEVDHTVPAVAYLIQDNKGKKLLYMGDTGPSGKIWTSLNESGAQIDGAIMEVSLPNSFKDRAILTGHMTPELLKIELDKMNKLPAAIYITHARPGHKEKIREELLRLKINNIKILKDGEVHEI
ncbi:MAG: 3',5'-cyclic-nucleotide phosphodiesterase [Nitrospirae bacterium]|nr:3',5'-cyclic-nucleotide phosphodiesterase [Nitrospirota bacterium]